MFLEQTIGLTIIYLIKNFMHIIQHIKQFNIKMLETWEELPPCFNVSSVKKTGKEELLNYIETLL